ncbi:MAG: pyridoxamine 5'-phosphate oxidase family protein [Thermoleophilaceae bacterium]|nr:pyridoxamine 5'-phosphate oxidase family protein [Thermoleophilaceae bacterium]
MASKRDQIVLTPDEIDAFLEEQRTVIVGTNGPRGVPHMMPLWYIVRGTEIWGWTFTKAQKIKNLERDPRATLLVEAGETYDQLRGVSFECDVELDDNYEVVKAVGIDLFTRYGDGNYPVDAVVQMIEAQAPKRTALKFIPKRTMSWDHRKLGGGY